ncbi:MAG: SoxR reducing system RseC family protein [Oscillospiraceae bacterium]|nr:SoxR reducing system RseC family protein [Oscillospiraceae bacterium]
MTQKATVDELVEGGLARVRVERTSACGHDCGECTLSCGRENKSVSVLARNAAGALRGDCVTIESSTGRVLGAAALVYILPPLLCAAVYLLLYALSAGETLCIAGSLAGLVLGAAAAAAVNRFVRHDRPFDYEIISVDMRRAAQPTGTTENAG